MKNVKSTSTVAHQQVSLRFATHYSSSLSVKLENFINIKSSFTFEEHYETLVSIRRFVSLIVCLFVCEKGEWLSNSLSELKHFHFQPKRFSLICLHIKNNLKMFALKKIFYCVFDKYIDLQLKVLTREFWTMNCHWNVKRRLLTV